jgi:hypothetical protein
MNFGSPGRPQLDGSVDACFWRACTRASAKDFGASVQVWACRQAVGIGCAMIETPFAFTPPREKGGA